MSETAKVYLLDSSVLIALATPDHTMHVRARDWLNPKLRFATCPITQGALLRFYFRWGVSPTLGTGKKLLGAIERLPNHQFWADDLPFTALPNVPIAGHRQVTDAYLAALAEAHGGVLATFDVAQAAVHPAAQLLP